MIINGAAPLRRQAPASQRSRHDRTAGIGTGFGPDADHEVQPQAMQVQMSRVYRCRISIAGLLLIMEIEGFAKSSSNDNDYHLCVNY
jgi:hypothetical protein